MAIEVDNKQKESKIAWIKYAVIVVVALVVVGGIKTLTNSTEHRETTSKEAVSDSTNVKIDPAMKRSRAIQATANGIAKDLYTYDSHKAYEANIKHAKKYVANSVMLDTLFSPDKDATGDSYIDNSGLTSEMKNVRVFISEGQQIKDLQLNMTLLIKLHAAYSKNLTYSGDGPSTTVSYTGTYDTRTNKFTALTLDKKLDATTIE